jgi:hypothetical protein
LKTSIIRVVTPLGTTGADTHDTGDKVSVGAVDGESAEDVNNVCVGTFIAVAPEVLTGVIDNSTFVVLLHATTNINPKTRRM